MAATPPIWGNVRRRFLILHGWQNLRPVGHWQRWLADQLAARGHEVHYPQLPDPDNPSLKAWMAAIESALAREPGTEQVVVAHSLACAAWIHLADRGSVRLPVDRILLVAPPGPKYLADTEELREFRFADGAHLAVAHSSSAVPRLACGDNDPYCSPPADIVYDKGFDVDLLRGVGHLDMVAGYGRWWSALRWCEDQNYRLLAD